MMKQEFKIVHKRVRRVNRLGNTENVLVKRHLYARRMFELYEQEYHIFNIDESWISNSDFTRKVWREKGGSPSLEDEVLKQKINIIVAVSNRGEVFLCQH